VIAARTAQVAAVVTPLLAPAGIGWAGRRATLGPQHAADPRLTSVPNASALARWLR
jgi:hypothetical protein